MNVATGEDESWKRKDLRKTCATDDDEYAPASSVEILGHPAGGITDTHRGPLAFRVIMTSPATDGVLGLDPRARRRMPVLPAAVRRRRMRTVEVTEARRCPVGRCGGSTAGDSRLEAERKAGRESSRLRTI
jgi:hypothetical protein